MEPGCTAHMGLILYWMTLVQSQNEHTGPHNIVGILSNPGVASYIPVQSHKFVEIDHIDC